MFAQSSASIQSLITHGPKVLGFETFAYPVIIVFLAFFALERIFARYRDPWKTAEARARRIGRNLGLGMIHRLWVTPFVLAPMVVASATRYHLWQRGMSPFHPVALLADFLILDFLNYGTHILAHKVPLLWRLHAVHHSDQHLDATTGFRVHFLEKIAILPFKIAAVLVFAIPLSHLAVFEVLSFCNGIIHHSNIRMPRSLERLLSYVITTPSFHRVHHHAELPYTDSNYGFLFSFWDRLFGTFTREDLGNELVLGVNLRVRGEVSESFHELLLHPVIRGEDIAGNPTNAGNPTTILPDFRQKMPLITNN